MDDSESEDPPLLIKLNKNIEFYGDFPNDNSLDFNHSGNDNSREKKRNSNTFDLGDEMKFYDNSPYNPNLDLKLFGARGPLDPDESEDVVPDFRNADILGWYRRTFHDSKRACFKNGSLEYQLAA